METRRFSTCQQKSWRILTSDHEWQVNVLDSVSNVDTAIDRRVAPVVAVVSWPQLATQSCNGSCCVLDDAPAEVWLVIRDLIEELVREDGLLPGNQVLLLFILDWAHVDPATEGECLVAGQSPECLIALHLVEWGEFLRAARHSGA